MLDELLEKAKLAKAILNDSTPYREGKLAISSLFSSNISMPYRDLLSLRLTVIDSYYSTNMSKRYYGIEDIAEALLENGKSDSELSNLFIEFMSSNFDNESIALKLFLKKYGMTKKGNVAGRSPSLVSKFAYFVTKFKYPIYDSLARKSFNLIAQNYQKLKLEEIGQDQIVKYFQGFKKLNGLFNDFDLLDNLLWLVGKIKEGNLSLLVKRSTYKNLIPEISGDLTLDNLTASIRKKTSARQLLGDKLCEFISFVGGLT